MKVVIFAGGRKGIRLREDTEYRPKALAPIGGYPIVWHVMNLYSFYGYNDFVLLLGPDGYKIKNYFLSYNEMIRNFTLELVPTDGLFPLPTRPHIAVPGEYLQVPGKDRPG